MFHKLEQSTEMQQNTASCIMPQHDRRYPAPNEVLFSPSVPLWAVIPNGNTVGRIVEIKGKVPYGADIFQINLTCGQNQDYPLHLSVRFNHRIVVRNTLANDQWGPEERDGAFPFQTGKEFLLVILTQSDGYYIAVNGVHCWKYAHRLPFRGVKMINVEGPVILDKITYCNEGIQAQVMDPNPPPSYIAPIYNPTIPLSCPITNGLQNGMMIYISARPSASVYRFTVNLQCGTSPYPPPDIAFHFDVRFFNKTIVRNTRINDVWGNEEVAVPHFGFQQAVNFDMIIRVEPDRYMVAVNGQHFIDYRHRILPLSRINALVVEKDIIVTAVRFG